LLPLAMSSSLGASPIQVTGAPSIFSMSFTDLKSSGVTSVKERPSLPARPVRPMRCT
jgi:hypothetical protein